MATVHFTFDPNEPADIVQRVVDNFDFTMPGADQSLGRDLAVKVAEGIFERSASNIAPDGSIWDDNAPLYAAYKERRYKIVNLPNFRTGQMLSLVSLLGDTEVTADRVTMKYGTGRPPVGTSTEVDLSESDKTITDIEKAYFCSKTRPFYQLDATIIDGLINLARQALDRLLRSKP